MLDDKYIAIIAAVIASIVFLSVLFAIKKNKSTNNTMPIKEFLVGTDEYDKLKDIPLNIDIPFRTINIRDKDKYKPIYDKCYKAIIDNKNGMIINNELFAKIPNSFSYQFTNHNNPRLINSIYAEYNKDKYDEYYTNIVIFLTYLLYVWIYNLDLPYKIPKYHGMMELISDYLNREDITTVSDKKISRDDTNEYLIQILDILKNKYRIYSSIYSIVENYDKPVINVTNTIKIKNIDNIKNWDIKYIFTILSYINNYYKNKPDESKSDIYLNIYNYVHDMYGDYYDFIQNADNETGIIYQVLNRSNSSPSS